MWLCYAALSLEAQKDLSTVWVGLFFLKKLFPTISLTASKTNRLSRQAMVHKTVDLERKQYSESHVRGL